EGLNLDHTYQIGARWRKWRPGPPRARFGIEMHIENVRDEDGTEWPASITIKKIAFPESLAQQTAAKPRSLRGDRAQYLGLVYALGEAPPSAVAERCGIQDPQKLKSLKATLRYMATDGFIRLLRPGRRGRASSEPVYGPPDHGSPSRDDQDAAGSDPNDETP